MEYKERRLGELLKAVDDYWEAYFHELIQNENKIFELERQKKARPPFKCFRCGKEIVAEKGEQITGCPYCHRSFCD